MSGSQSSNNDALNYQKQMDTAAQAKEDARQARLKQGTDAINAIYEGSPVMANRSKAFDWGDWGNRTSQFGTYAGAGGKIDGTQVPGMPAGYTYKVLPGGTTTVATPGQTTAASLTSQAAPYANTVGNSTQRAAGNVSTNPNQPNYQGGGTTNVSSNPNAPNYQSAGTAGGGGGGGGTSTGASSYGIVGPDGKVYKQGDKINYNESYDTGQRTGGFDDAFYNKYNQAYLDLNNPEEQRAFNFAKQKLLYNATDQGIVNSSMMGSSQGELARTDTINKGNIIKDASTATANLRKSVDDQKQAALNLLYSTNDPTVAETAAQSGAKSSQLQSPTLTPASSWFDPALSTLGGYINNVTSPYNQQKSVAGGGSSTSPQVASASKDRGVIT